LYTEFWKYFHTIQQQYCICGDFVRRSDYRGTGKCCNAIGYTDGRSRKRHSAFRWNGWRNERDCIIGYTPLRGNGWRDEWHGPFRHTSVRNGYLDKSVILETTG